MYIRTSIKELVVAAENGIVDAMINLAGIFYDSFCGKQYAISVVEYEIGYEEYNNNDPYPEDYIDDEIKCSIDFSRAIFWLTKASEAGSRDANLKLAYIYQGEGEYRSACRYYELAYKLDIHQNLDS